MRLESLFKKSIWIILIFIFLAVPFLWVRHTVYRDTYISICDQIFQRYFEYSEDLRAWHETCLNRARQFQPFQTNSSFIRDLRSHLYTLGVSHLEVFDPQEELRVWAGLDVDTGIRVRDIDGHFITYTVLPKSPAERAGILAGDEIVTINQQAHITSWDIEKSEGWFQILRNQNRVDVYIKPESLRIDDFPKVVHLGAGIGWLKISSFREEYFEREDWTRLAKSFYPYQHLIVDIRQNWGGNFVAMLRSLSTFLCQPTYIGSLIQPRRPEAGSGVLKDDLDQQVQLKALDELSEIQLQSFPGYPCFEGQVTVLTDSHTASVSEIFAGAMALRSDTELMGLGTAGDVVLAVWYPLPTLGPGYSLSIPEAVFMTPQNEILEGQGVWPDQVLTYKLEDARKGIDSFIKAAMMN